MNSKLALVILAGGLGSRYKGSKQIESFGTQHAYLLEFAIYDALKAGFSQIVLVVNEAIKSTLLAKLVPWKSKISIDVVVQTLSPEKQRQSSIHRMKPWGTAQALLCAERCIKGPFVVMNADDYYGQATMLQAQSYFSNHMNANGLIAFPLGETLSEFGMVSRGICSINDNQELVQIQECHQIERNSDGFQCQERRSLDQDTLVSMNFWMFQPSIFPLLSTYFNSFFEMHSSDVHAECYLPQAVQEAMSNSGLKVSVLVSREKWLGITFPEDKKQVDEALMALTRAKKYPKNFHHE